MAHFLFLLLVLFLGCGLLLVLYLGPVQRTQMMSSMSCPDLASPPLALFLAWGKSGSLGKSKVQSATLNVYFHTSFSIWCSVGLSSRGGEGACLFSSGLFHLKRNVENAPSLPAAPLFLKIKRSTFAQWWTLRRAFSMPHLNQIGSSLDFLWFFKFPPLKFFSSVLHQCKGS